MTSDTIVQAIILGTVEGLTEFIPVSSTGHILLLGHFIGFQSAQKSFEVLIQLGAILAILTVYSRKLFDVATNLHRDPGARRFVAGVVIAFLPAAVLGAAAHGLIKTVLFASPVLICSTLVAGGVVLLIVDRLPLRPRYFDAGEFPILLCFKIGLIQTLAMVPGVSRSGATIAGALLLGTDKRSAAEFSFFLAMPTMAGAFALDLYKNGDALSLDDAGLIGIGFVTAFIAAVLVVRSLLDFIGRHGFAPFAIWRIAVGLTGFAALAITG
jgi:undecaprenyl-diphosphatase